MRTTGAMRAGAALLASASLALTTLAVPSATGASLSTGTPTAAIAAAASTSASYVVSASSFNGSALTLRWDPCQPAVTYRVNVAAASSRAAGRASALADVRKAFTVLARATGITFRYLGTTDLVPSGAGWADRLGDAEIVVAWVDRGAHRSTLLGREGNGYAAGTGGYSYKVWQYPATAAPKAAIGRGYVVLNAADNAAFAPGFGAGTTRGLLLLHELGHAVGLKHVTRSSQVMYPVLLPKRTAAYGSGDLAGLAREGRSAGCIGVPDWVWVDH